MRLTDDRRSVIIRFILSDMAMEGETSMVHNRKWSRV